MTAALAAALVTTPTAVAMPQLPAGVSVQDIVGAPIAVPAGQTTTVDLGIPVTVNYAANG